MRNLILIVLSIFYLSVSGQGNYTYFSKTEVEKDLAYTFEKLNSIHPLFLDKSVMDDYRNEYSKFESILKDSITQNEVYLLLAPFLSSLNDGHTGMLIPIDQRIEYNKAGGKSFPFFVNVVDSSIYNSFYCGNDPLLFKGGEQILSINGINSKTIIRELAHLVSGESIRIKQKEIANKFRLLIWMRYGFEEDYQITIINSNSEIEEVSVKGITSKEFKKNLKRKPQTQYNKYILILDSKYKTAVMGIKSFSDLDGFCSFADSSFNKINNSQIENLVIDIRNNTGGRSIVVDSLLNYITDKEYAQYKSVETRISPELQERYRNKYPERLAWLKNYEIDSLVTSDHKLTQPKNMENRFNGNLFLLTNGLTYSAAATFTGVFKELNLGAIIGEETGGTIAYYGDFWFLETPNTGIKFHVSPKRFIQYGGNEKSRGVKPDYFVQDKYEAIMNFTYKMIEKGNNKGQVN